MTDSGAAPSIMGGNKANMQIIYILQLLTLLSFWTAGIAGVVMAYVARAEAPEWLKSHYEFAIGTFWLGVLGSFIGVLLMCTLILIPIAGLLFLAMQVWLIIRCVQGLNLLGKEQPVANPKTWLFAA